MNSQHFSLKWHFEKLDKYRLWFFDGVNTHYNKGLINGVILFFYSFTLALFSLKGDTKCIITLLDIILQLKRQLCLESMILDLCLLPGHITNCK